jgi:transcriptional regulator with XRE-family HTH domain
MSTKTYTPFALRLRAAREAAGFETASDAARYLGLPIPTVVAHEGTKHSGRNPKLQVLEVYAIGYKVSLDYLLGRTLPKPPRK